MYVRLSIAFLAAAAFGGCANATAPTAPPPAHALAQPANARVGIWAADSYSSTIYGVTGDGTSIVSSINTAANGCDEDFGLKVDDASHLWVACEDSSKLQGGSAQEYRRSGVLLATYQGGCPKNLTHRQCEQFVGDGLDVGFTASDVFVSDWTFELEWNCDRSKKRPPPPCGNTQAGTGFEYWPIRRPSAKPTLINLAGSFGSVTINNVWYFDLDGAGNIWSGFNGCGGGTCGAGLLEIENPTTSSPAVIERLAPGTFGGVNGVYISNGGTVVNVADDTAGVINSYKIAPSFVATPFRVLGPVAGLGSHAHGEPVAGGFRDGDHATVWGDANGWLDLGTVHGNKWTAVDPGFMRHRIGAAVYAASDK